MKRKILLVCFILYFTYLIVSAIAYQNYVANARSWFYIQHNIEPDFILPYSLWSWGILAEGLGVALILGSIAVVSRKIVAVVAIVVLLVLGSIGYALSTLTPLLSGTMGGLIDAEHLTVFGSIYFDQFITSEFRELVWKNFFTDWVIYAGKGVYFYSIFHFLHAEFKISILPYTQMGNPGQWTCNPDETYTPFALQNAIYASGQKELAPDGYWRYRTTKFHNFAIFVTDAPIDMVGLSIPVWNAMIITQDAVQTITSSYDVVCHEICHQYGLDHCGGICLMNPTYVFTGQVGWCQECHNELMANVYRWQYVPWK